MKIMTKDVITVKFLSTSLPAGRRSTDVPTTYMIDLWFYWYLSVSSQLEELSSSMYPSGLNSLKCLSIVFFENFCLFFFFYSDFTQQSEIKSRRLAGDAVCCQRVISPPSLCNAAEVDFTHNFEALSLVSVAHQRHLPVYGRWMYCRWRSLAFRVGQRQVLKTPKHFRIATLTKV